MFHKSISFTPSLYSSTCSEKTSHITLSILTTLASWILLYFSSLIYGLFWTLLSLSAHYNINPITQGFVSILSCISMLPPIRTVWSTCRCFMNVVELMNEFCKKKYHFPVYSNLNFKTEFNLQVSLVFHPLIFSSHLNFRFIPFAQSSLYLEFTRASRVHFLWKHFLAIFFFFFVETLFNKFFLCTYLFHQGVL